MKTPAKQSLTPTIARAFDFIRRSLSDVAVAQGTRLPSLEKLARRAGASRSSMWKALVKAKAMKLVTITPGGYITAGAPHSVSPLGAGEVGGAISKGTILKHKQRMVAHDILNGHFHERGQLPSNKEMQNTYGISAPTLRKVLLALAGDGLLIPYRKTWRLPRGSSVKNPRSSIVLLSEGISSDKIIVYNERLQKLIETLENVSAQSGIQTVPVNMDCADPDLNAHVHTAVKRLSSVLGYIINIPWTDDENVLMKIAGITESLARSKTPVAVFDTLGTFSLPRHVAGMTHVRIFRIASFRAGTQVARHLLGLGHKRVAFISANHNQLWSIQRLAGLTSEFAAAGYTDGVVPFTIDTIESDFGPLFWFGDLPYKKMLNLLSAQDKSRIGENPAIVGKPHKTDSQNDRRITSIRSNLAFFGRLVDQKIAPDLFDPLRDLALGWASLKGNRILIEPFFNKALSDKAITAWVCANDGTSWAAHLFLSANKVKIPRDISVIGFDNRSESLENRLATYDFNVNGILHRMIWFFRQPVMRPARKSGPEEVEGMIIERESVGRAKQMNKHYNV